MASLFSGAGGGGQGRRSWVSRKRGTRVAVDRMMREALQAVLDGDGEAAEALLGKVVQKDSSAIDAYVALAHLLRERGEVERAIRIHQNLLLRPDLEKGERIEALVEVGRDYVHGGYPERALASFEEAIAEDGKHRGALAELARLSEERGDFERALWLVRRLSKLEGERDSGRESRLWTLQGEKLLADGDLKGARKAARRALRLDSGSARSELLLGRVEQARGKGSAALAAFAKIPELDPELLSVIGPELADAYAKQDKSEAYHALLRERLASAPAEGLRSALVDALASAGEHEEAAGELSRWAEEDPTSRKAAVARARLALSATEGGADSAAEVALRELLRVFAEPEDAAS